MKEQLLQDTERQLQAVLNMSQAGIVMTDATERTISFANKRMAELFECALSELTGTDFKNLVHPTEIESVRMDLHTLFVGGVENLSSEVHFIRKDGVDFWGSFSAVPLTRDDGSFQGMVATIYDVTEQRETEKMMSMIESNYWEIFNSTNDALFVHDAYTGAIVDVNKTVEKMYGYTREEILFMNVQDFSAGEPLYSLDEAVCRIRKAVEEGPQTYEWLSKNKDGELFWTEVALTASHIGGEGRVLAVIRDITDRKEIEKRLQYLSSHDSLTGLYNRAHFETEFVRASKGRNYPLSVIVADLDGLKAVNDCHGHAAGDRLIKAAAVLLRDAFRPDDLVARMGGDEFAVLLPRTDSETTASALERIRNAELRLRVGIGPIQVRFSLGSDTATIPQEVSGILNQADMRMYEDKASHKLSGIEGSTYNPLPTSPLMVNKVPPPTPE